MRIGFSTVLWGRRIDNLGYALDVIAACGYQGVEFAQHHSQIFTEDETQKQGVRPVRREELLIELEKRGMKLTGLVGGTLEDRKAFLGGHREAYLYIDTWDQQAEDNLKEAHPFTLAVHPHWFMPIRKLKHARDILERHQGNPHVGLLMDTAHFTIAEDDPVKTVQEEKHRLIAVHLKGWKPNYGRWSHRYAHGFCPPGEGIVKVEEVMDALHAMDFPGWVIMEQDHHDGSREEMTLKCAKWMQGKGGRWNVSLALDEEKVKALLLEPPKNPFLPQDDDKVNRQSMQEYEIGRELSHLVSHSPRASRFYMHSAKVLRGLFECVAVKIWSYNPMTEEFQLMGVDATQDLRPGLTVLQADRSLAGKMLANPRIHSLKLESAPVRQFQDTCFLEKVRKQANWMTSVPVFNTSNPHHLRFLVTMFTEKNIQERRHELERVSWVVAQWSDYLIDEICASVYGATNHLCGEFHGGVTDFINALMNHLKQAFRCMNVTVFLRDVSGTRLEPAGDTVNLVDWTTPEHYYHKEDKALTVRAWREREMVFARDAPRHKDHAGKAREKRAAGETREEILFAVLARWQGPVLGVVRLQNKVTREGPDGLVSTMFTDDDAAKLDAIIQAALPYLELLVQQQGQAFALTCMAHELQNPLLGILGASDFLREKLKTRGLTDLKQALGADYLEDIVSYQALASRLVHNARLFSESFDQIKATFQHTDVVKTVINPIVHQMRPLLRKHRMPDRISTEQEGRMPWLYVDHPMMQQVFFNLLANAIKYNDGAFGFAVDVRWGVLPAAAAAPPGVTPPGMGYFFEVEDNGMGIDGGAEEAEMLFLPGVRSQKAQHKNVEGTGIGLAVVRRVVEAHGGTVSFASFKKPTRLRIELPAALLYLPAKAVLPR